MSLLARLGYSALAVTTLGGGGTTIALSSKSSSTQELPLAETVTLSPQEVSSPTETVSETPVAVTLESPSSEPSPVVNPADSSQGPTLEKEEQKVSDPAEEYQEQAQNLLQEGPKEEIEDTEDEPTEVEEGPEGNCKFISFAEEKIPAVFGVTKQDYFSIFCKDGGFNSLPSEWTGWFPKDLFEIDVEQAGNKEIDIKVDDAPGLDEDDWFGARFSSPKFKNNRTIDARWTYYSEDSDWAEVELISANNTKAYLLLTEDSDDEEHED